MIVTEDTARRIVSLHETVRALRKDIAEIDSGTLGVVTVSANYQGPEVRGSYQRSVFKREVRFDGDQARWISNLIRERKQLRLDAFVRELRQLNAEVPE